MNSFDLINLARKHASNGSEMQSSAMLCLKDALSLFAQNKFTEARNRSLTSLRYSIGVLHPDYIAATQTSTIAKTNRLPTL